MKHAIFAVITLLVSTLAHAIAIDYKCTMSNGWSVRVNQDTELFDEKSDGVTLWVKGQVQEDIIVYKHSGGNTMVCADKLSDGKSLCVNVGGRFYTIQENGRPEPLDCKLSIAYGIKE